MPRMSMTLSDITINIYSLHSMGTPTPPTVSYLLDDPSNFRFLDDNGVDLLTDDP